MDGYQQRSEQPQVGGADGNAGFKDGLGDVGASVQRGVLGERDGGSSLSDLADDQQDKPDGESTR